MKNATELKFGDLEVGTQFSYTRPTYPDWKDETTIFTVVEIKTSKTGRINFKTEETGWWSHKPVLATSPIIIR